jgi:site-specific recombinase XerD
VKGKRDRAIMAVLAGCGLRRSEVAQLTFSDIQTRDDRWVIVDLYGKGGHIRTVPVPEWVKSAVDCWTTAAQVTAGRIFRCVSKTGTVWGEGITEKLIWCIVKEFASKAQLGNVAPHDLRRYAVCRTMPHFVRSHAPIVTGDVMNSA